MDITLTELAELLKARLPEVGAGARITGFASLQEAGPGDLSFYSDPRYRERLESTKAGVILVPEGCTHCPPTAVALEVPVPSQAFQQVVEKFGFQATPAPGGIHPSAVVAAGTVVDASRISIGANAVVEPGAQLAEDVEIGAGCYVGRGVKIGRGSKLFANVTVHEGCTLGSGVILHSSCVIGADGFGYEFVQGRHKKVRQAGTVQIDNDVEIGACTTVDRARFGRTWIGEGTKIDNQVQIGHNAVLGKHCIVVAGTGIAGSAHIGDYVVIAAQSGVAGHVTIGSQCTIAARGGVTQDLPPGPVTYMGFPAVPAPEERRRIAVSRKLPELLARVRALETKDGTAEQA